jgi:dTDP-4-dehydrorhamnose reductase
MRDMPILVAGTGLIGSAISAALRARGAQVTCADVDMARAQTVGALLGCAAVELDIADAARAAAVIRQARPAIVVHAAGRFNARTRDEARRLVLDSARGTASLTAAATAAGVGRLLLVSSLAAYANPRGRLVETSRTGGTMPYGLAKSAAESALLAGCAGTETTPLIARLSGVYGGAATMGGWLNLALHGLVDTALRGDQVRIPAFLGGHEYLHVRDAAAGAMKVAEHGRAGPYNIGTSRPLDAVAVAAAFATLGAAVTCEEEDGKPRLWWLDTSRARAELGFEAGISLADGLRIWAGQIAAERAMAAQVTARQITAEEIIHEEVRQ